MNEKEKMRNDSVFNDIIIYTPKRFKKTMSGFEIKQSPKITASIYMACILFSLICNMAFHLNYALWPFSFTAAIVFAPIIAIELIRAKNEHKKFTDINSYAQQFINSMQLHHKVLFSLENTLYTFPNGKMHDTIEKMLLFIKRSKNPKKDQVAALVYLDNVYPNTQTPMIHDFAQRVEQTGGNFEQEMNLLNVKREKWEKRIEHEQAQSKMFLTGSVILYIFMFFTAWIVVAALPTNLNIMQVQAVQIAELLVTILFFPFVYVCCNQFKKGWLRKEDLLNENEANKLLNYIDNYNPKTESKKSYLLGAAFTVGTLLAGIITQNIYIVIPLFVLTFVSFNLHSIKYYLKHQKVKKEVQRSLPRWLFDICLCLQKQNIVASIENSLKTAPPILKQEVIIFLEKLRKDSTSIDAYLEFLCTYNIPNVSTIMRALLSIVNGTGGDNNLQMSQLIEHNLNLLDEQESQEEEMRRLSNVRFKVLSSIPATSLMFVYFIAIIVKVFDTMNELL